MKVNPRDTLEPLRALLHSPTPDLIEIDALLSSIASTPDAELVWDYFAETAADRVARHGEGAWSLLALLLRWRPEHPAAPSADLLLDAWRSGPGALECLASLARRGRLDAERAARRWAMTFRDAALVHPRWDHADALHCALRRGATVSLAVTRALPDADAMLRQARLISALVRPVPAWGAERLTQTWLGGEAVSFDGFFDGLWATLTREGQAYLRDPIAGRAVGTRGDLYTTLDAFAVAASGAAAVADIAAHRDEWSEGMVDRVAASFWSEVRAPLFTAGLELPPWSQRAEPIARVDVVSVSHIDVDYALTLTRAAAASLDVLGQRQSAARLRDAARVLSSA